MRLKTGGGKARGGARSMRGKGSDLLRLRGMCVSLQPFMVNDIKEV